MNSPVQQIKERLSIIDVVSSYIKTDQAGANFKAKCPFHNEKTASFFISPLRGTYYCFGCGASGDIFSFVEEFEGLDFKGALKLLAGRAGVTLSEYKKEGDLVFSEKERLYLAMEEAVKYFADNLLATPEVLEYLKSRGVTDKTIQDFSIGYALPEWRGLYSHLNQKGFTDMEIERAGLVKKSDKTGLDAQGPYDRFRGRIMFPISDSSGRVIAFSGRIFVDDEKSAKYLNSPDTPIFSKSAVLYGLDRAKESIRKNNFSILVEGQMDLVLSHQAGYRNTIATSGTALSDATISKENAVSSLGLIRRLSPNIVLAFDGDRAGRNASSRAGRIGLSLGMDVKVAKMPEGVDPADLISKTGVDAWKDAIRDSKHIIEFLLDKVLKDAKGDARKTGREIKEVILPFINALESSIEKMHFIKKISDASSIPENAIKDDLKKIEQELKYEKKEIEETGESLGQLYRKDYILRKLLGIILWQKTLEGKDESQKIGLIHTEDTLREISEILKIPPEEVLKSAEDNREDFIFEAEVFYGGGADINKDTEELLINLKEEYLREELGRKMRELYISEENKDSEKSAQILQEFKILNDQMQNIKNSRLKQ